MLEFYVERGFRLRRLRRCPVGEQMDGFAAWLQSSDYKRRPGQLALRGAAHLGYWAAQDGISIRQYEEDVVDEYARHLPACACTHSFRGRARYHAAGARRFVEHLRNVGVLLLREAGPETDADLVEGFSDWMSRHRGVTESTLANYLPLVRELLEALGDDVAAYDAARVRAFIFARAGRYGLSRAKSVVNVVRMFLRFLAAYGKCPSDLAAAVPKIAEWKLSSLPRYLSAGAVERLGCDV